MNNEISNIKPQTHSIRLIDKDAETMKKELKARFGAELIGHFSKNEIRVIYETISEFPLPMFRNNTSYSGTKIYKKYFHPLYGLSASTSDEQTGEGRDAQFYNSIKLFEPVVTKHFFAHELAHVILTKDYNKQFLRDRASWGEGSGRVHHLSPMFKKDGFVSSYARTSEEEDMAEVISMYISNKAKLLSLAENDPVIMAKYKAVEALFNEWKTIKVAP